MDLEHARQIASEMVSHLSPACTRIEVAGSVRRGKAEVHDIDLVLVPRPGLDLWKQPTYEWTEVDSVLGLLEVKGRMFQVKGGDRYRQLHVLPEGLHLELWLVLPPAQWGVIFTLRTGPAEFGHWLVTKRSQGGALPSYLAVREGAVYNGDKLIPTPEEADFFRELNLKWTEPAQRCPGWKR